jgi:FtsP/CotA-like multicopper oxidase with cupredoxin domain
MKKAILKTRLLAPMVAMALLLTATAFAAAPGIKGTASTSATSPSFDLVAGPAYISQPDGQMVYSWGYGCATGFTPTFAPAMSGNACTAMQVPGPTLVLTEGQTYTVRLTNNLPVAAGNTSILFPGFTVTSSGGLQGLLTREAAPGSSVSYTFTASTPGTRAYYSGTQSDLQIEMGLYGAIIVVPSTTPTGCTTVGSLPAHYIAPGNTAEVDFRLAAAAYDSAKTCYDREYLFQFSEIDPNIHAQALAQVNTKSCAGTFGVASVSGGTGYAVGDVLTLAGGGGSGAAATVSAVDATSGAITAVTLTGGSGYTSAPTVTGGTGTGAVAALATVTCQLDVPTEPYHPAYFMINGRSMPDDMDPNYAPQYPHQPYNGNPHMHPGEQVLLRIIGQGRWQHPFHEHGNHVRILGRDGNLIQSVSDANSLAGPLLFTTTTTPGVAMDGIFYWTGRGLNWDPYGHNPASPDPLANTNMKCDGLLNGYHSVTTDLNYYEWCQDHNKPVQVAPFGDVAGGGPVTLPDANILTNGAWYGGSPYLGPNATTRATGCLGTNGPQTNAPNCGSTGSTPPSGTIANPPGSEAGFAFMWHSHNEREITTNNIFPGGMMMMMLVDSREFQIDESN